MLPKTAQQDFGLSERVRDGQPHGGWRVVVGDAEERNITMYQCIDGDFRVFLLPFFFFRFPFASARLT